MTKHKHIEHERPETGSALREVVFGVEDGMVSTLGAVTGIATATQNPFTTILSGFVIIAVESISMGVGSYLSNKSKKEVEKNKLKEEMFEIKKFPKEEREELMKMYTKDGWPEKLARQMADTASKNDELFLTEMAYRELKLIPETIERPLLNGVLMLSSYIIGGFIPLSPYLFLPFGSAILISIITTIGGLFILGAVTTMFTKRSWWKAGLEMLALASAAALVGYAVGQVVESFWLNKG